MEAETRRKVEDMVLDILKKSNIQETTEFTIRVAASERLGVDLSDPHSKHFVRNIIESYLLSIATDEKPPQETTEVPVVIPKEPLEEEFTEALRVIKRRNDDSERFICQLSTKRNVVVRDFKGTTLVSIREFYKKDGKQLPTSKGISLSSEQWSTFKNSVPAIEEAITKLEGRIRSEPNGKKNREVSSTVACKRNEKVSTSVVDVPVELVPIEIVRFDGKNYQVWAQQMELLLEQLKIKYVLTNPCPNATLGERDACTGEMAENKAAENRWVIDNLTCRRNILSHLSDNLFNKYAKRKMSAKELWEDLKFIYLYEKHRTKRYQTLLPRLECKLRRTFMLVSSFRSFHYHGKTFAST
uniref:Uncharacterized protein LOC101512708 isoform X2 n=1 Tax=Cicer arietinum TaxID=3827 RepID=A0A1S3E237_CICAR|nr:uncharacterized protein LOC101512708 isoform X2 [Cicer arietinum]